jgi:parallel beta-helix repeat protein
MMSRKMILTALLALGYFLTHFGEIGWAHQTESMKLHTSTNAATDSTGVVFVGNNIVDLKWSCESGCDPLFRRDGTEISIGVDFYRDIGVSKGVSYLYDLCCICETVPTCEQRLITTGEVQGNLHQTLDWGNDTYVLHGDVRVWQGAILNINGSTVENVSPLDLKVIESIGHSGTIAYPGGDIRVSDAIFYPFTGLTFSSQGENHIKHSSMQGHATTQEIVLTHFAKVEVSDNNYDLVEIMVEDQSKLTAFSNELVDCHILMRGTQPYVSLIDNRFYDAEQSMAICQYGGHSTISGNVFYQLEHEQVKTAAYVQGYDSSATTHISFNVISGWNHGIFLSDGVQSAVNENLILNNDDGIFIRYDASAQIEGNTITENQTGIKVWDSPEVNIHQSCIAGNISHGLAAYKDDTSVDASENWWGHESGPLSEENPNGLGDIASGNNITVAPWLTATNCIIDLVTTVISTTGGTIQSSDNKITVEIPAEADSRMPLVLVLIMTHFEVMEDKIWLNLFLIYGDRLKDGSSVSKLDKEATLTIKYSDDEVANVDQGSLAIHVRRKSQDSPKNASSAGFEDEWVRLPSSQVDLENNLVTATIDELSAYALIGELAGRNIYLPFVFNP